MVGAGDSSRPDEAPAFDDKEDQETKGHLAGNWGISVVHYTFCIKVLENA